MWSATTQNWHTHNFAVNMKKSRLYIGVVMTVAFVAAVRTPVMAQVDSSTYNENVIIKGSFNPVIDMFDKINVAPHLMDTAMRMTHKFDYSIEPYRLTSVYAPSRFKAARVVSEPRTRLYNNYFRIGLGNKWSPLLDAYLTSTTSRQYSYGFSVNHRSSWGTLGDSDTPAEYYGPAHYSLTDVALFGKAVINESMQLNSDISFQNDYNLYYGFTDSVLAAKGMLRDNIETADYKASYSYLRWNVGLSNVKPTAPFRYDVALRLADLMAGYGQNEFNFGASAMVGYNFDLSRSRNLLVALRGMVDGYSHNIDSISYPLGHNGVADPTMLIHKAHALYNINPYLETELIGFNVHAGVHVALDGYSQEDLKTYLFPDVRLERSFLNNDLGIVIGAEGVCKAMSWNELRLVNPYIMPGAEVSAERNMDFYGGIRYNFSKRLNLNLRATYLRYDNVISFIRNRDYQLGNVFRTYLKKENQLQISGDINFVNDERIAISLGGMYNFIFMDESDSVPDLYDIPYDLHLNVDFNHNDRWLFHARFMLIGPMNGDYEYDSVNKEYTTTEIPLRPALDIELEYRHNRFLSAFLRFDNLLFQRYMYWHNYPSHRGLFTLGLTFTIPHGK